eukprot:3749829-Rhodomonas_salina.5
MERSQRCQNRKNWAATEGFLSTFSNLQTWSRQMRREKKAGRKFGLWAGPIWGHFGGQESHLILSLTSNTTPGNVISSPGLYTVHDLGISAYTALTALYTELASSRIRTFQESPRLGEPGPRRPTFLYHGFGGPLVALLAGPIPSRTLFVSRFYNSEYA